MIGRVLGRYRVEGELGRGGMGVVYQARDLELDRRVAIKAIAPHLIGDEAARRRFLREAQIAASLDHPFICKVHEILEQPDGLFLVLEFVSGKSLSDWIASRGSRPSEDLSHGGEVLRVASEIAEAIAAAHSAGIVHRDIKPSNILVTASGHPKILDFGLAKAVEQAVDAPGASGTVTPTQAPTREMSTRAGVILGTYGYLAPEVLRGAPANERSDLFALGCVLYFMATGSPPFAADTPVDGISRTLTHIPEPPSSSDRTLPRGFDGLVASLLQKDPALRLASAGEVRRRIEEMRVGSRRGRPSIRFGVLRGRSPSRRLLWTLGLAACGAIGVLIATSALRRGGDEPSRPGGASVEAEIGAVPTGSIGEVDSLELGWAASMGAWQDTSAFREAMEALRALRIPGAGFEGLPDIQRIYRKHGVEFTAPPTDSILAEIREWAVRRNLEANRARRVPAGRRSPAESLASWPSPPVPPPAVPPAGDSETRPAAGGEGRTSEVDQ